MEFFFLFVSLFVTYLFLTYEGFDARVIQAVELAEVCLTKIFIIETYLLTERARFHFLTPISLKETCLK